MLNKSKVMNPQAKTIKLDFDQMSDMEFQQQVPVPPLNYSVE